MDQTVADHPFHVDVLDNPATATQCRKRLDGLRYCPIPRDLHPKPSLDDRAADALAAV